MISMQTSQDHSPDAMGLGLHICREECQAQVAEAEKEMSAFVVAVERMWGPIAASHAAEYWIELAESISLPLVDDRPNWRRLTVLASSRLAMDGLLNTHTVGDEEGRWKVK